MKIRQILVIFTLLIFFACHKGPQSESLILRHVSIYSSHDEYCAWPAMIRAQNGDLLVSFCINEEHLGLDGKIVLVRSQDNGNTWSAPQILYDTPIDDRHAGMTLLTNGDIITHCWSVQWSSEKYRALPPNAYEEEMIDRWCEFVDRPEYQAAKKYAGQKELISHDNGKTWSAPIPGKDSIHGGVELPDGRLLVASYRLDEGNVGVYRAEAVGKPWRKIAVIDSPNADSLRLGEPHILRLPTGRIIMMIRATAKPYNDLDSRCHLYCSYSDDDGSTWVPAFKTPLWGYPPHLLLLADGRVLCTYGYRRPPFGQRACISEDGITWKKENEIILRADACNKDLGYPVSVELKPGIILSVYYQPDPKDCPQKMDPPDPNRSRPDILGTIWKVPPKE